MKIALALPVLNRSVKTRHNPFIHIPIIVFFLFFILYRGKITSVEISFLFQTLNYTL